MSTREVMQLERKGSIASCRHKSRTARLKRMFRRRIPIVQWLPNYTPEIAVGDLVAGITLGITIMPQSIAYAQLANLPPRYGLYSALMGGLVYLILGTVKQVTIGPTSLMAIITLQFTRDLSPDFVVLLTFLTGLLQLIMGVLRLGFLVDFISTPVLSGFQTATAVITIVAQMKHLGGLKFRVRGFINRVIALWQHLPKASTWDLALGISGMVFLLLLKRLNTVVSRPLPPNASRRQHLIRRGLWFLSISRNALCLVISSVIAKIVYDQNNGRVPFLILGDMVPGLPSVGLPPFSTTHNNRTYTFTEMVGQLGMGPIVVPVVGVLANVAIAKAFASGNTMDASQEMLSLALCNLIGSTVSAMPSCGAFTRSAVSQASGVRTPMLGLYTFILVFLALSFLTPMFHFIPRSTLAAVLICAVMFLIDITTIRKLWRSSKRDLVTLVATLTACILVGVEVGLVVGMTLDLTRLLHVWARPRLNITIVCEGGGQYVLVRPSLGLLFPGVDTLRALVSEAGLTEGQGTLPVVLDSSPILALDYTGIKGFQALVSDFESRNQRLLFVHVDPEVRDMLNSAGLYNSLSFCNDDEDIPVMLFGDQPQHEQRNANILEAVALMGPASASASAPWGKKVLEQDEVLERNGNVVPNTTSSKPVQTLKPV